MTDPIVTVDASAAKSLLTATITGVLRIGGAALVTHGILTQPGADAILPALAQDIAGAALIAIGQGWAWLREQAAHSKLLSAALTSPSNVIIKGVDTNA